jgi:hypothetical protein
MVGEVNDEEKKRGDLATTTSETITYKAPLVRRSMNKVYDGEREGETEEEVT